MSYRYVICDKYFPVINIQISNDEDIFQSCIFLVTFSEIVLKKERKKYSFIHCLQIF